MESLYLEILKVEAVLMPFEINCHTIPHIKALTCCKWQGRGSTFIYQNLYLKNTYFTSYRGKRECKYLQVAVYLTNFVYLTLKFLNCYYANLDGVYKKKKS